MVKMPQLKQQVILLGGGLDLSSSPIARDPGFAIGAINVEPGVTSGYRRTIGYDRFDGHPSPSRNKGYYVFRTDGTLPLPSAAGFPPVTWAGGAGVLLHVVGGDAFIGALAEPGLIGGDGFSIGGQTFTLASNPSRAARTLDQMLIASANAADWRRTFIGPVPGIGPVRCVVALRDDVYAIRDKSVTEAVLFKAGPTGWQPVGAMGTAATIRGGFGLFDGDVPLVCDSTGLTLDTVAQLNAEGDSGTLTIPAGQALANGDILRSAPDAAYPMTLSAALADGVTLTADTAINMLAGGTIAPEISAGWYAKVGASWFPVVSYMLKSGTVHTLTLSNPYGKAVPANTAITLYQLTAYAEVQVVTGLTLKAGGRYEVRTFNFYGAPNMRRAYLASGVQRCLELREDGRLVPLRAKELEADDQPTKVEVHADHLFLAYRGGTCLHSGPSNPLSWSGLLGAELFAVGDEITGMSTTAGGILLITCLNRAVALYGSGSTDWQQKVISESVGVRDGTLQPTFIPIGLSDRGLVRLDRVQSFGDFNLSLLDITGKVQPIVDSFEWRASTQLASANQYRLFSTSGRNLAIKLGADGSMEATEYSYGAPVDQAWRYDELIERNFFTLQGREGWVYELDEEANSFDGGNINWLLRLAYTHAGSPAIIKSWRSLDLEQNGQIRLVAKVAWSLDYRFGQKHSSIKHDLIQGGGADGIWNYASWNNFYWPAGGSEEAGSIPLEGHGVSLSLSFSDRTTSEPNFTLTGLMVGYIPRRDKRG